MAKQVAYGEATVRNADGVLVSRATGTFLLHRPDLDPTPPPPPDPYRVPASRPRGVPRLLRPRVGGPRASASPAGGSAHRLGAAARRRCSRCACARCPGPLYAVLMGYKESPVARGPPPLRADGAARCSPTSWPATPAASPRRAGGAARPRRSPCRRPRGPAVRRSTGSTGWPAPSVDAAFPAAALVARRRSLRTRVARGSHAARRPAPSRCPTAHSGRVGGRRAVLLDDTYVSGARAQSAAAALRRAGARSVVIVAARAGCCGRTASARTPPSFGRAACNRGPTLDAGALRRAAGAFRRGAGTE